ncbi:hypothetical protein [Streptomyces sioyaensis]|uniref:hypothetical protein n=1 Tax=Streptomyces sioyaensis TaxID=67364 RepID=UPI001F1B310B|nr:hypothetical protein [Streptomyces sioyaensis]
MRRLVTKATVTVHVTTAVTMLVITAFTVHGITAAPVHMIRALTVHVITAAPVHVIRTFTVHVIMVVAGVTTRMLMAVRVSVIACHTAYRGTASRLRLLP